MALVRRVTNEYAGHQAAGCARAGGSRAAAPGVLYCPAPEQHARILGRAQL